MLPQSRKKSRKKTDGTELDRPVLSRPRNLNTRPDGPAPLPLRPPAPADDGTPPGEPVPDGPQDVAGPPAIRRARLVRDVPGLPPALPPPADPPTTAPPVNPPALAPPTADAAPRARLLARSPVTRDTAPQIPMPAPEERAAEQERREPARRGTRIAATVAALQQIYAFYYTNGTRNQVDDANEAERKNHFNAIYDRFTTGSSSYTATPIDYAGFEEFRRAVETTGEVESQIVQNTKNILALWRAKKDEYDRNIAVIEEKRYLLQPLAPEDLAYLNSEPPQKPVRPVDTIEAALAGGDYIRVFNRNFTTRYGDLVGKVRRIIVNVVSQQAALAVAAALSALYERPGTALWISEYKVFLSTAPLTEDIKLDKIVVYYLPQDGENGEDLVGGILVSAISAAIPPGTAVDEFGPFYAPVAPGIAWAEDPSTFPGLQDSSFSQSRISAVAAVVRRNESVPTADDFIALVAAEMRAVGVDPFNPHRHVGGPPNLSPRPSRS
ncbi:hypothetical protein EDD29_4713 [Actinocorallia herbida]|uniref:Uncharacterized protein n=1 Tax=Actinocorallia herbida TaxID=58109 RepID=A0A3N1D0S0_9ACTN|nr:T3SS effector HopA1 family protein [Actinocorallia herbida]ROO87122.1 hypothetical protein EDD29_4713 [Actinocorallia herbida]